MGLNTVRCLHLVAQVSWRWRYINENRIP